jgi:predicted histidine transporter YuiF (NhaC family)
MSITWAIYATLILAWLLLLVRYGVLALIAGTSVAGVLGSLPITMDLEKWYSGIGMLGLVLVCAVPLYGAAAAVGGRTRSV